MSCFFADQAAAVADMDRVWIAHDSITPPDHCHNARGNTLIVP